MPNPRLDEEIYNDLFGLCTDPSTYMAFAMTHAASARRRSRSELSAEAESYLRSAGVRDRTLNFDDLVR